MTITIIWFQAFSSSKKETPYVVVPYSSQSPSPKVTTDLLSLCSLSIGTFHINRIIQYVIFSNMLLSLSIMLLRFIHIVEDISTSFHFVSARYTTFCLFISWWPFFFLIFGCYEYVCCEYPCVRFCVDIGFIFSTRYFKSHIHIST